MNKKYIVHLSRTEREFLYAHIQSGKYKNTRLRRAQILLGSDQSEGGLSMSDQQLNQAYGASIRSIERTRQRFVEEGFELALHGKERPVNRKIKIDARVESQLIAMRCSSETPLGHNSWTLRLLADKMVELGYIESISHQSVDRILKKHQSSLGE